jgi:hypothetical protein
LSIVKTIEFISISSEGLDLLHDNIDSAINIVSLCFDANKQDDDDAEMVDDNEGLVIKDVEMLYAAATILLDLSADEEKIEKVSLNCNKYGLFSFIINHKLNKFLNHSDALKTTQLKKLRDLFIGMTLNLTCNIDEPGIVLQLLKEHNVLDILIKIIKDTRQDWPTHGASQALMQYSHLSMQDAQVYKIFEEADVATQLRQIMTNSIIQHPEASRHI